MEWQKIFVNYIPNKQLIIRIYKNLNNNKNPHNLKMGKDFGDVAPDKVTKVNNRYVSAHSLLPMTGCSTGKSEKEKECNCQFY